MVDVRSTEFVADDVFDLVGVERDGVFLEMVQVHVCCEWCVHDGWISSTLR